MFIYMNQVFSIYITAFSWVFLWDPPMCGRFHLWFLCLLLFFLVQLRCHGFCFIELFYFVMFCYLSEVCSFIMTDRKGVDLVERRLGEKFERIMGGKAEIKIYYMRKQSIFSRGVARAFFPSNGSSAFPVFHVVFSYAYLPHFWPHQYFLSFPSWFSALLKNNSYSLDYLLYCCFYYCVCGNDSGMAFCSLSSFLNSRPLSNYIFVSSFG